MDIQKIIKALSNEKRLNILMWLKDPKVHFKSSRFDPEKEGICVGLIEIKSGLSQSTVSSYLLQLHHADLITMTRLGQWTFCKLNRKTVKEFISALNKII